MDFALSFAFKENQYICFSQFVFFVERKDQPKTHCCAQTQKTSQHDGCGLYLNLRCPKNISKSNQNVESVVWCNIIQASGVRRDTLQRPPTDKRLRAVHLMKNTSVYRFVLRRFVSRNLKTHLHLCVQTLWVRIVPTALDHFFIKQDFSRRLRVLAAAENSQGTILDFIPNKTFGD